MFSGALSGADPDLLLSEVDLHLVAGRRLVATTRCTVRMLAAAPSRTNSRYTTTALPSATLVEQRHDAHPLRLVERTCVGSRHLHRRDTA
jgi:hypothetical protein